MMNVIRFFSAASRCAIVACAQSTAGVRLIRTGASAERTPAAAP